MDKPLHRLRKIRECQINKIRNEKGEITTDRNTKDYSKLA
jgi:hypothetical protein